jgi:TonB-linked SusC/RagA family outer membrane protein
MKKKLLFSLLILCGWVLSLQAQKSITGKVTSEDGQPLVGASIVVKGTNQGAVTDIDGNYAITATPESILVVSFVGYQNQEMVVSTQSVLDIILLEGDALKEVVVVGYGTQRKANVTGAIASVKSEDLLKRQVASTSNLLQGIVPGLMATQQSGRPGGDGARIRIRGEGSIYANTYPLILVDDVPVSNIDVIDPNDVESMSVLKDASAAAIYGSRAANGVILIKSKRGGTGTQVQYSSYVTTQKPTNLPTKVSAVEHMEMLNLARKNQGGQAAFSDALVNEYKTNATDNFRYFNTDWLNEVLTNSGIMHNHNLSVRVGSEKIKTLLSGSYLNQQGLTPNTDYKRFTLRANTDMEISKNLSFQGDMYLYNYTTTEPAGSSAEAIIRRTLGMPANAAGRFADGSYGDAGQSNKLNPIALAEASGTNKFNVPSTLLRGSLAYKPFEFLELRGTYAHTTLNIFDKTFRPQYQIYRPELVTGTLVLDATLPTPNTIGQSQTSRKTQNYLAQATLMKKFGAHDVSFLVGVQAEDQTNETLSASRTDLPSNQPYLNVGTANQANGGGASENATAAAFGRLSYSFSDRYLLELSGRYDGSSRFSQVEDKQWGFFPSVSAGWILSEEKFMKSQNLITFGKIRASYGILGNQNIPGSYPFTTNLVGGANYYFNNRLNVGVAQTTAGNPIVTWEKSKQQNIGVDLTLRNSWDITFDVYQKDITDMLLIRPIPSFVGFGAPFVNAGSMSNKGWELSVGYRGKKGDFSYNISGNISDVKNEVTDLAGQEIISGNQIVRVGYPIYSYFGYQASGLFQDSSEFTPSFPKPFPSSAAGDIRYKNINGPVGTPDSIINQFDRAVLGNNFPRLEFGLNLGLNWKGIFMNAFVQGVGRRDNYASGTGAWAFHQADFFATAYTWHKDNWRPDNKGASYPRLTETLGNNQVSSSYWMRSGAYWRLKNVQIGYTLPKDLLKKMRIGGLTIYASGQNLFTKSNFFEGFDAERDDNNGQFYPIMKTYTVGLNLKL